MRAFILAGGFATRLWPLTEKRAKPLLPLAGKPILTHLVERIPANIPVTVSTNAAFAEGFEEWKTSLPGRDISLVIEGSQKDDHKLGALGATAEWIKRERIDDDLLLLTGDNYLGFPLSRFLEAARPGVAVLAAFDIKSKEQASLFGTVIVDEKEPTRIVGFEEKPREAKTTLVSTGCSLLPKQTLPVLLDLAQRKPDNVGGLFEEFLNKGLEVDCFTFTEPWLDIGSFGSYLDAHRLLVGKQSLFHPEATILDGSCEGSVVVGKGSRVESCDLEDCIVFENCVLRNCVLRNCIIDDRCALDGIDLTDKMLRAGTILKRQQS